LKLLFDASAILNLSNEGKTGQYIDHETTPLAQYEIGNTFWKKVNLTHELTQDVAKQYLAQTLETLQFMNKIEIEDAETILEIATREHLSYYDASYIHAAATSSATLITDDAKLRKTALKYVPASDSQHIPTR
jgi:predicted nucleic acid-binding protein